MGTRNSTLVKINNEYKVAQYGQWDGYPEGQGAVILNILRNCDLNELKEKCSKVRQISDRTLKKLSEQAYKDANRVQTEKEKKFGLWPMEVSDKFKEKNPHLHRDCGGEILQHILNGANELQIDVEFPQGANGGFGCEWCYIVDFDKNVLEVYDGTIQSANLVKSYDLNKLPSEEKFIKECNKIHEKR